MLDEFQTTVESLLTRCWHGFYEARPDGRGLREFKRDLPKLRMAILRYGKECSDRGWEFDLDHFAHALTGLLNDVLGRADSIGYLPTYLDGAVTRHIGQRAEQLNEKAKVELGMDRIVGRVVADVVRVKGRMAAGPRPVSATEIAAQLYAQLRQSTRAKAKAAAAKRTAKQSKPQLTFL